MIFFLTQYDSGYKMKVGERGVKSIRMGQKRNEQRFLVGKLEVKNLREIFGVARSINFKCFLELCGEKLWTEFV